MTDPTTHSPSSSSSSLSSPSSSLPVIKDPRYQRGKIYQIIVLHEDYIDELYVGSTICKLFQRFGEHKTHAKGEHTNMKLHVLMRLLGFDCFKIVLVEDYPCDNKEELRKREQYHMKRLSASLNIVNAHTTLEGIKTKQALYQSENKEEIKAKQAVYRSENKEELRAQKVVYYSENKEKIKAYQAVHRSEHKEELKAKRAIYLSEHRDEITARYRDRREEINARRRALRAKKHLTYRDKVFLAVKEAVANRPKKVVSLSQ